MSAPVDHELRNAWEGALAGGGDPASSPLYVFGPFLALIVAAGVADMTFGASIWLAVLTITVVALLYRLVMRWVTDGSGGTGLSEEELGPWAAKTSAAITCIEYTLTFLVSIAALVTFVADRVRLDSEVLGVSQRAVVAIVVSILCGWLVNRGPRIVSLVFGPATAGVLVLLWVMMIATVAKRGLELAPLHIEAFTGRNLRYTLGGFVRILALMTGIEVFANLVASYSGTPKERSRRAFTSLAIIMGSTALTMVLVGPAILALADPSDPDVSVFTQTMDALLPHPLALAGTAISVLVLLSAAAASAIGIQSLFLGLSIRHYAPALFADRNASGVAGRPVWVEVAAACTCFLILGTSEDTYLAVYAAGVFVLLSMTSWSAVLRLARRARRGEERRVGQLMGVVLAAGFTTVAMVVIVVERFADGVWIYFVMVPAIASVFGIVRRGRGDPGATADRIGRLVAQWNRGERTALTLADVPAAEVDRVIDLLDADQVPLERQIDLGAAVLHPPREVFATQATSAPWHLCVPLDGSSHAEHALRYAAAIARRRPTTLTLIHVHESGDSARTQEYLEMAAASLRLHSDDVRTQLLSGEPAGAISAHARDEDVQLVILSTHGRAGVRRVVAGNVARSVVARRRHAVLTVPIVESDAARPRRVDVER